MAAIAFTDAILTLGAASSGIRAPDLTPGGEHRYYRPDLFSQAIILIMPPSEELLVAGIVINEPTKMGRGRGIEDPAEGDSGKKQ